MSLDPYQNDWDTPPNGDFVRYLERLAAAAPTANPVAPTPANTTPPAGAAKPATTIMQPILPLANQWAAVLSVLHKGRNALLWLTLAHLMAWLLLDRGSVPLLLLMVAVWVAWGQALAAMSDNTHLSSTARAGLERLQQEIRSLAQQRPHEKSKK